MTAAEMDIVIGAEVSGAVNGLKQVNAQLVKTEQTASKFSQKSGKDFTGLSRIIQDLPFGFIAISNNLTQLLPAAGAAGLAISALVSVITFASTGFSNWTRGLHGNKEALEDNAKAVKELDADAGKEIAHLTTLTNAAKDTNLSMKERLAAVKLLQDTYPTTFANYEKEKILNGEVAAAIQATSNALFQRAVVRQKESQLGPIAGQLFDLRQQREELEKQEAALKRLTALAGQTRTRKGIVSSLFGAGSQDKQAISNIGQQMAELDKQILPLQGQFKRLSQAIIDAGEAAGEGIFSEQLKDTKKKVKEIREELNKPINFIKGDIVHFANIVGDVQKELDIHPLQFKFEPFTGTARAKQMIADMEKLTGIIKDTLINEFSAIGETLGNVLAGAKNPFAPIMAVLSEGLKTLGKAYIQIGVEALIAQKALKLLMASPYLTIAAGIAFVALGSLLQSRAKNIKAFATGGVVTRPTLALVGEQGPERITPLGYEGRANNMMQGEVVFQISGQNLRGILRRADQAAFNTF